jgi:hypothetical protein
MAAGADDTSLSDRHRGEVTTTLRIPRAETFGRLAIASVAAALLVVGYLTATLGQQVDPIKDPVSDYEFHGAGGPLFVAAVLLLISGGVAVIVAMGHAGLPRSRAVRVFFGLWCAGLSLVAVFPANRSAVDPTASGEIHRFGGAVYLTCLPIACWLLARSLRGNPQWTEAATRIRRFAVAGAATAAAFGASEFAQWPAQGLLERFALGSELALVVVLALAAQRRTIGGSIYSGQAEFIVKRAVTSGSPETLDLVPFKPVGPALSSTGKAGPSAALPTPGAIVAAQRSMANAPRGT